MKNFKKGDIVKTVKEIKAGIKEDGPIVCSGGATGRVASIEKNAWDGITVELDSGMTWWFKSSQLILVY